MSPRRGRIAETRSELLHQRNELLAENIKLREEIERLQAGLPTLAELRQAAVKRHDEGM